MRLSRSGSGDAYAVLRHLTINKPQLKATELDSELAGPALARSDIVAPFKNILYAIATAYQAEIDLATVYTFTSQLLQLPCFIKKSSTPKQLNYRKLGYHHYPIMKPCPRSAVDSARDF